ncbi:MAG: PepSY-associated TM helix domain-containing protein [Burkholderiaceae bacterium]|nr:PepSY-associated TM helix domain-containing protein [Burkholderiaceae bacterium]
MPTGQPARSAPRSASRWFSVHRWLGILVGLWFALVGLTGAILVYEEPIDAWLNPDLLVARGSGPMLAPGEVLARAEAAGLGHVERLRIPQAQGDVYRLLVRSHPTRRIGNPRIEAMFDPASGALLGMRSAEQRSLAPRYALQTIYEFHRNVLLGEPGSNIVGIAGFLLLTSAVSGIVLAWPRQRTGWARLLAVNLRASATRFAFDAHRSLGAVVALLLLLATLTGVTLVYTNYVRDLVSVFSKVQSFPTIPFRQSTEDTLPLDRMVATVRQAFPQQSITEIRIPFGQMTGMQFYLRAPGDEYRLGDTIAWVHPGSGEILVERSDRTRTAGETFMHWLFPLHSGSAFGPVGMLAMFVTGLAPMLLVGTGLWVWLRKRRGERIAAAHAQARRAGHAGAHVAARGPTGAVARGGGR